jgi:NADPH-ferrihemoprotein reductase
VKAAVSPQAGKQSREQAALSRTATASGATIGEELSSLKRDAKTRGGAVNKTPLNMSEAKLRPEFESGRIAIDVDEKAKRQLSSDDRKRNFADDSSYLHSFSTASVASYHSRQRTRTRSTSFESSESIDDNSTLGSASDSSKPAYLTIYFASQSGTSAYYAAQLQREGVGMGFDIALRSVRSVAECLKSDPFPEKALRNLLVPHSTKKGKERGRAVFLVSTYQDGGPTDDARRFVSILQSLEQHDCLKGLRYAVFGFGDSAYSQTFNTQAKLYDSLLEDLGGKRMVAPGFGDRAKDIEYQFETFKWRKFWPKLADLSAKDFGAPASKGLGDESTGERTHEKRRDKKTQTRISSPIVSDPEGGFVLEILKEDDQYEDVIVGLHPSSRHLVRGVDCPVRKVTPLCRDPALDPSDPQPGSVMLVELDLTPKAGEFTAPFKYEVGDNIAVLAVNPLNVVKAVVKHLDYDLDTRFVLSPKTEQQATNFEPPFPSPCSVREYLSFYCELSTPPRRSVLRALSRFATLKADRDELHKISSVKRYKEFNDRVVKENIGMAALITEYFPSIQLPLVNFIRLCSPMQPRWYSASSSPLVDPTSLTFTFSVITIPRTHDDSVCRGLCSHYLSNLSTEKPDTCRIMKMGNSGLVPPKDPNTPVILVCNGTGISPMRALLQELNYKKMVLKEVIGPVVLFFGIRRRDYDFLFEEEISKYLANGSLSELQLACSREQVEKVYVQHVLADHGDRVWKLLQEGAHMYVCGVNKMTTDVDAVLRNVALKSLGPDEVKAAMHEMEKSHRYIREEWTSKVE